MKAHEKEVDFTIVSHLIVWGLIGYAIWSALAWVIGIAAVVILVSIILGDDGMKFFNEIFSVPEQVKIVEEKQDDMADILGLSWYKIPEQRFYDKKGQKMDKYDAKNKRKLAFQSA